MSQPQIDRLQRIIRERDYDAIAEMVQEEYNSFIFRLIKSTNPRLPTSKINNPEMKEPAQNFRFIAAVALYSLEVEKSNEEQVSEFMYQLSLRHRRNYNQLGWILFYLNCSDDPRVDRVYERLITKVVNELNTDVDSKEDFFKNFTQYIVMNTIRAYWIVYCLECLVAFCDPSFFDRLDPRSIEISYLFNKSPEKIEVLCFFLSRLTFTQVDLIYSIRTIACRGFVYGETEKAAFEYKRVYNFLFRCIDALKDEAAIAEYTSRYGELTAYNQQCIQEFQERFLAYVEERNTRLNRVEKTVPLLVDVAKYIVLPFLALRE